MTELGELIDSGAVRVQGEDRLGHEAVAAELAELALTASTPSNIALFGPWGSGKTGIGNLLEETLKARRESSRFVRYDAYKYAETPLRRHFLEAIASQLGAKAQRVVRDRYESKSTNKLTFPPRDLGIAALAFGVALVAYVAIALLLTWASGTAVKETVGQVRGTLPGGIALSAILAIVFSAFGNSLTVQVSRNAPATDDEFESLFVQLVQDVREKRLVVFIDELDRCSPLEVTATLDAIRTFLGVEKCVFIVSADQQVLERALSSSLRQHTPVDTANPYYSSGSAVLDKLFAQQLHVPPPLRRRLTLYALDLVRDRPGLWSEIDLDRAVSVLIPSHVTSPRRIKTLLNNFAVQYRLATRRAHDGSLDGPMPSRAQELAKLVCLRTEFPLFAAHLADDSAMVALVVDIHLAATSGRTLSKPDLVHEATWLAALDFATGQAPVDVLLDAAPAAPGPDEGDQAPVGVQRAPAGPTQRSQSAQFLDYLVRTRSVPGPSPDLIHLEHAGMVYGLPNEVTHRLETAAVNGDVDQVLRLVQELASSQAGSSQDPAEVRERAIRILVEVAQQAAIGIEGDNVARVLLAAIGTSEQLNDRIADLTVDCLRGLGFPTISDEDSCRHVLRLIAHTTMEDNSLAAQALDFIAALDPNSDELDAELVRVSGAPAVLHAAQAPTTLATVLRRSERARSALAELDGPVRAATLGIARGDLLAHAAADAATVAAVPPAPPAVASAAPTAVSTPAPDMSEIALADLVVRFGADGFIGDMIVAIALEADRQGLRTAVFALLGEGRAVSNAMTASLVLIALRRRHVQTWAPVLRALNESLTQGDGPDTDALRGHLRQLALHSVDKCLDPDQHPETWSESLSELMRLIATCGPDLLVDLDASTALKIAGVPSGELAPLQQATKAVHHFLSANMLPGSAAVDALITAAGQTITSLAQAVVLPDIPGSQVWLGEVISDDVLARSSDAAVTGLFAVVPPDEPAGSNMPAPLAHNIAMRCAITLRHRNPGVRVATPEAIATWITDGPAAGDDSTRSQLLVLADTAAEIWGLLTVAPSTAPGTHTRPAITRWISEHEEEADELARMAIASSIADEVDINLASAVVSPHVDGDVIATELIRHFEATQEYVTRLRILRAWQALGVLGQRAVTRLVRLVFVPFIKSGAEAASEGARAVRVLFGANRSAQKEAIDLVREVISKKDAEVFEMALVETGLRKRRRRILGIPFGSADDDGDGDGEAK